MATVRKRRGRWAIDYRDHSGCRHIELPHGAFPNAAVEKLAAQALLTKRLAEVSRGDQIIDRMRLTYAEVGERYLQSKINVKPSTARSYRSLHECYLAPYFGTRKIEHLTTAEIERFRGELMAGVPAQIAAVLIARQKAAHPRWSEGRAKQAALRKSIGHRTINKTLTLLVMILNYAGRHRWVDFNAAEHVERLPDPRGTNDRPIDGNILGPSEIVRLIDAADGVYKRIIQVAVFTGMRQSEILGLQWGDLDWNSRQLYIRRSWREGKFQDPKTRASRRRVDLPEMLIRDLKAWKLECPLGEHELIFPNRAGNPQSYSNLMQRGFYPALRRAGLRKIRFHDLRHTFASLMLANGEDIVRVSRLLGHASPHITLQVYAHLVPKENYGSTDRLAKMIYATELPALAA